MKNKGVTILLTFFFGWLGIHRFYLGQKGKGILYILSWLILLNPLLVFIDFIVFIVMSESTFNAKYNKGVATNNATILNSSQNKEKVNNTGYADDKVYPSAKSQFIAAKEEKSLNKKSIVISSLITLFVFTILISLDYLYDSKSNDENAEITSENEILNSTDSSTTSNSAKLLTLNDEILKKEFSKIKMLLEENGDSMPSVECSVDRILYGDVNNDSQTDGLVQYNCSLTEGGNANEGSGIIIWGLNGETPEILMQEENVGKVPVEINSSGEIIMEEYSYADGDPMCCPSIMKKNAYKLINGKMKKVTSN